MACPFSKNIAAYLDEQLSVSESKSMGRHLVECKACRKELREIEVLFSDFRKEAPSHKPNDEETFLSGVMDAIEQPPKKHRRPQLLLAAGIAIAVLIPSAFISLHLLSNSAAEAGADRGAFTARGGSDKSISTLVDVVPLLVTGKKIKPIDENAVLGAEDGLTFQYSNAFDAPLYFIAFAVDERGDVHWFYPAYLKETDDPAAVLLSKNIRDHLMPEIVSPENVQAGALELVTVVSSNVYTVKQIEKKLEAKPRPSMTDLFSKGDLVQVMRLHSR